jgi:hypothetical protein
MTRFGKDDIARLVGVFEQDVRVIVDDEVEDGHCWVISSEDEPRAVKRWVVMDGEEAWPFIAFKENASVFICDLRLLVNEGDLFAVEEDA